MSVITINGQAIDLSELPVDALLALQKHTQEAKADLMEKVRSDLSVLLSEAVEQIHNGGLVQESSTSPWTGASITQIQVPVTYADAEGEEHTVEYSVTVRITDTERTKEREPQFPKKPKK